jgi:D-alanyl-D-alanine carboxypeptidase (penicillin-binding protein 5/6)
MMKMIYPRFCVAIYLFLSPLFLEASTPLKVDVSAKAAILMNAETGAVLWEKNAHVPRHPASTTKVFTALYALEAVEKKGISLEEMVTASQDAACYVQPAVRRTGNQHPPHRLEVGGTHMGLKIGETLPLRVLFYGLMLSSGNDAANVIAEYVSGSIPKFMEELNQYVKAKGCQNTILFTPHGLPHQEHKTTAYDMALIAKEGIKKPLFREIVKTRQYPRPATNKQPEAVLYQHNALVKPGKFYYSKAIGIKTGYTLDAGYSLVGAAEDTGRKLIVVLFGCENLEDRYKDAIALFEAGFNEKKTARRLFSRGFDLFSHPVEGAKAPLQAYLAQDMELEYYPSEEPVFKTSVTWHVPALPIRTGQKVGEMCILNQEGQLLSSAPIFAAKDVEATFAHQMNLAWNKTKQNLWDHVTLILAIIGIILLSSTFYYSQKASKKKHAKQKKEK